MNRTLIRTLFALVGLLFTAAAFMGGVVVGRTIEPLSIPGVTSSTSLVAERVKEVEELLNREALNTGSETSKTAGAISGLLESTGDRHAAYFDPAHYGYFNEQSHGEFYGIGVNIAERDKKVYIVSVIKGTPAERAGIKAGDIVVEIDGVKRDNWTTEEVVKRVRGPEGTIVKVTMLRPEEGKKYNFTIERARIDIPNIMTAREGEVGYIRLLSFNTKSADELRNAITAMEAEGAKGFVLDLRDNAGGLLQSAVDVASLFIPEGVIVTVKNRAGDAEAHSASRRTATDNPLVVLINGNSASASEVLAGALQDYGRAQLVGERSFGKGSVQSVRELSFGGAVKFTTAYYLTPKGRAINGTGLTPDVIVPMDVEDQADKKTDIQRSRAVELVREKLRTAPGR